MNIDIKTTVSSGVTFWHCLFCWRTTKSKSTIKAHMSAEHAPEWRDAQAEAKGGEDENSDNRI